jgi:hypothetical protein
MRIPTDWVKYSETWPSNILLINGKMYRWSGWFGCQLESVDWRRARAGEQIVLDFKDFNKSFTLTAFGTERLGLFRFRNMWALSNSGTHDEHTARIYDLQNTLRRLW